MIEFLKSKNNIDIVSIQDKSFCKYGRVVDEYDFVELIDFIDKNTEIPQEGNVYVPNVKDTHQLKISQELYKDFYGEMPVQIGYCNGHNVRLDALEYHKSSEINIAITDSILLMATLQDIEDNALEVSKIKAFYIGKGEAVELYATTLHFSPCAVHEEGFKMIIILPEGTNLPLVKKPASSDPTLWMKNKWLIAHKDAGRLIEKGVYEGIVGDNIIINF